MRRSFDLVALAAFAAALLSQACSGDDTAVPLPQDSGSPDATLPDASSPDANAPDVNVPDSNVPGTDSSTDVGVDAACPSSWAIAPATVPALDVPDGGGGVLFHASATGSQDYACTAAVVDAGTSDAGEDAGDDGGADAAPIESYSWVFVGPEAALSDCNAALVGHHFASDAGPSEPEWETTDGTYVIGKKAAAYTVDGGAAIPWLLLDALSHGGTGTLSEVSFVQRVNTIGGLAPTTTCDGANVGTVVKVAYTADYYFFGNP